MVANRINKAEVRHLLETTSESYRGIARRLGCSRERVRQIAKSVDVDLKERAGQSRKLAGVRRVIRGKYADVRCPRCGSDYILSNGKSKRYRTQRYICGDCKKMFMTEYKWITTGDRDKHLTEIAHCSGYTRSDGFDRWQRMRGRVWPYLVGEYSEADDLLRVVNEAIPRTVPEHMRADICQDALVAILECEIEQSAITLKPFIAKWFRQNGIGYRPLSLDQPSRRSEGQTVGQEMGLY